MGLVAGRYVSDARPVALHVDAAERRADPDGNERQHQSAEILDRSLRWRKSERRGATSRPQDDRLFHFSFVQEENEGEITQGDRLNEIKARRMQHHHHHAAGPPSHVNLSSSLA